MLERFVQLFTGGELAHGVWDQDKGARTVQSPATAGDYEMHLNGVLGLGLVPIRKDGTCRFAAVDIDIDTIDHAALLQKVEQRRMPLHVCRSKSGGAHLYLFMQEPGLKASKVIPLLKRWAMLLGYPNSEIFPKQAKISPKNIGNWINLPYYGGVAGETTRYCMGPSGALTLEEFVNSVKFYDPKLYTDVDESVNAPLIQISTMPPCLAQLTNEGVGEGHRNQSLFNFAVYYRKSSPNGWEEKVVQHNQAYFKPPLSNREVQSVLKSAARVKYQYLCDQEPLCSRCDRQTCLTLPYGVGHKPWEEAGVYDQLQVNHLRKLDTDPPRYIVEVNGNDIDLDSSQLRDYSHFQGRCFEVLDLLLPPLKPGQWHQTLRELIDKMETIAAPKDASFKGQVLEKIADFFTLRERAKGEEDLLKGLPVTKAEEILFRAKDLVKYLSNAKLRTQVPEPVLYQLLHLVGCKSSTARIKGKVIGVWRVPVQFSSTQTEEFDVPDFGTPTEEML